MNRLAAIVVAAALLVGAVPAAATLADQTPSRDESEPGATFAGVIGVQQAEVSNEVASRELDQRLAAARSNSAKAAVVADVTERLEQRLAELERRKGELEAAYENGTISRGQYQAKLAQLAAEIRSVERRADRTADAADGVSEEALREKGVNVSEVRSVAHRANESGDGDVGEAASNVTGEGVGNGLANAPGQSGDRGKADERGQSNGQGTAASETESERRTGGPPTTVKPTTDENGQNGTVPDNPGNGSDNANEGRPTDPKNGSNAGGNGDGNDSAPGNGDENRQNDDSTGTTTPTECDNGTATTTSTETDGTATTTSTETDGTATTTSTETDGIETATPTETDGNETASPTDCDGTGSATSTESAPAISSVDPLQ